MKKLIPLYVFISLFSAMECFGQNTKSVNDEMVFTEYEKGKLKDGFKEGIWEYFDKPQELSLKINYDKGTLVYLKSDTSDFVINVDGEWTISKLQRHPRYVGSMAEFYKIIYSNVQFTQKVKSSDSKKIFYIIFEVDSLGHADNFNTFNNIGNGYAEEMIRVLKIIPNYWLTAFKENRNYTARFILPVLFNTNKTINEGNKTIQEFNSEKSLPLAKMLEPVSISATDMLTEIDTSTLILLITEEMPQFKGGEKSLTNYIENNLAYPEKASDQNIHGRVIVTFVVDTIGNIIQPEIFKGIGGGCDEEALRLVNQMPHWTSGKQGGIPVNVRYYLPILFSLKDAKDERDKHKYNPYNFYSETDYKIGRIVMSDIYFRTTYNYTWGDNYFSMKFRIDSLGKPSHFVRTSSWGKNFLLTISSDIISLMQFPAEEKTMYFHLKFNFTRGALPTFTYYFTEASHYEY